MSNQTTGLNRSGNDTFFTKKEVASQCVEFTKKFIDYKSNNVIVEPSAGDGAFIEPIKQLDTTHIFFDIKPLHPDIMEVDYLTLNIEKDAEKSYHVIGNPPFGRQSNLAIQFLKRSAIYAASISMILPKSFRKSSMQKYIDPNFHLEGELELPENCFLIDGHIEHNVPCVFQVWVRKSYPRKIEEKLEPIGYKFVKKEEEPDISFRRVGVNAGVIDENINKSEQSHYFIRFDNRDNIVEYIEIFRDAKFLSSNDTVGPKSISKQEIIKLIKIGN